MAMLPKKRIDGFKTGANKVDQQRIKAFIEKGIEASEVSAILKIKEEVVANFYPKKKRVSKVVK